VRATVLQWAAISLVLGSCSLVEPVGPQAIEVLVGDGQRGVAGRALELPLVVRVTDHAGRGVADVEVSWRVSAGDGAFDDLWESCDPAGDPTQRGNPVDVVTSRTDAAGQAWVWFEPLSFGPVAVSAEAAGLERSPRTFDVDIREVGRLSAASGDGQEGRTGDALEEHLSVRLTNASGEPIEGVAVQWEIESGEGTLSQDFGSCGDLDTDPATLTVRTLEDGVTGYAQSGVRFRPAVYGISTVLATVPGAVGSPVGFSVDVNVQSIDLYTDNPFFPDGFQPSSVTVPVGARVELISWSDSAWIASTSAPPGGTPFDSGPLAYGERHPFMPDAPGTWAYVDRVSGWTGAVTAEAR